jgi:hypothetical protein
MRVCARASAEGLARIVLHWRHSAPEGARILGDARERGYGDLQWRTLQPDGTLPWYVMDNVVNGMTTLRTVVLPVRRPPWEGNKVGLDPARSGLRGGRRRREMEVGQKALVEQCGLVGRRTW